MTVDMPVSFEFVAAAAAGTAKRGGDGTASNSNGKGKMKRSNAAGHVPSIFSDTLPKGGKAQTISFAYPNWERYAVRKAD